MSIESTEHQLITATQKIGCIAETSNHYTNGLAKLIEATGKTIAEITLSELITLDTEYKKHFNPDDEVKTNGKGAL